MTNDRERLKREAEETLTRLNQAKLDLSKMIAYRREGQPTDQALFNRTHLIVNQLRVRHQSLLQQLGKSKPPKQFPFFFLDVARETLAPKEFQEIVRLAHERALKSEVPGNG